MITCTITPPPDVLARLAACPALPRGERGAALTMRGARMVCERKWRDRGDGLFSRRQIPWMMGHFIMFDDNMRASWRSMARPLRDARQKLREARTHARTLEQVCAQQKQRIQALVRGEL